MQAVGVPRSLLAFPAQPPDERSCAESLPNLPWPGGFRSVRGHAGVAPRVCRVTTEGTEDTEMETKEEERRRADPRAAHRRPPSTRPRARGVD